MRILIIGSPRAGKSNLAQKLGAILGIAPRGTDLLKDLEWSQASETASHWFDDKGPWVIEGTMGVRALRKWLQRNPRGTPADLVLYRDEPFGTLIPGQVSMAKAVKTIFAEILPDVVKRGVNVMAV